MSVTASKVRHML